MALVHTWTGVDGYGEQEGPQTGTAGVANWPLRFSAADVEAETTLIPVRRTGACFAMYSVLIAL